MDAETDKKAGRYLKNAISNVGNGASSALLALVLPPVLSRNLSNDQFGAWALILQISAYTSLLAFGMQGAVGRFIALAEEKKDRILASQIASTALALLCGAAVGGVVLVLGLSTLLQSLIDKWPPGLLHSGQICLIVTGCTLALGLPFTTFNGIFLGLQRNEIPAIVVASTRLLLAIALSITCIAYKSLLPMAAAYGCVNVFSYLLQWLAYRRFVGSRIQLTPAMLTTEARRKLLAYSASFTVWTLSMLLVNGIDTALVGRFDFEAVAVYASVVSLTTFQGGVQQALFNPLLAISASLDARAATHELGLLLMKATRISACMLFAVLAVSLLFGREIIVIWLGGRYADEGAVLLGMLMGGQCLRLIAFPYSVMLLGTNQHHRVRSGPVAEGISNAVTAIVFGHYLGAIGVALGLIVGGVVGQAVNYFVNIPKTGGILVDRWQLIRNSVIFPFLCFLPSIAVLGTQSFLHHDIYTVVRILSVVASSALVWRTQITQQEKSVVTKLLSGARLIRRPVS